MQKEVNETDRKYSENYLKEKAEFLKNLFKTEIPLPDNSVQLGLLLENEEYDGQIAPTVVDINPLGLGAKYGMKLGDRILAINQTDLFSYIEHSALADTSTNNKGKAVRPLHDIDEVYSIVKHEVEVCISNKKSLLLTLSRQS